MKPDNIYITDIGYWTPELAEEMAKLEPIPYIGAIFSLPALTEEQKRKFGIRDWFREDDSECTPPK